MIKPASSLPKKITRQQIIDFYEDYLMSIIDKYAAQGRSKTTYSYTISLREETGELRTGLESSDIPNHVYWRWLHVEDYPEMQRDFEKNGYWFTNERGTVYINWN